MVLAALPGTGPLVGHPAKTLAKGKCGRVHLVGPGQAAREGGAPEAQRGCRQALVTPITQEARVIATARNQCIT